VKGAPLASLIPWSEISEVRLSCEPSRFDGNRYYCRAMFSMWLFCSCPSQHGRRCLSRRLGDPQVDPHFGRFALGLDVDHHNPPEAMCSVGRTGFDAAQSAEDRSSAPTAVARSLNPEAGDSPLES
jgi:hypothetical protein